MDIEIDLFSDVQKSKMKFPKSLEDVRDISQVLSLYTDDYYVTVMTGFCLTYLLWVYFIFTIIQPIWLIQVINCIL